MRDAFHEDLDKISDQLVTMTTMVATALERATTALLEGDRTVAESVIAADDDIDTLRREIERLEHNREAGGWLTTGHAA